MSERAEELLRVLSETYLANPQGEFTFVKTITPNKDSELNEIWRAAYDLTHEKRQ